MAIKTLFYTANITLADDGELNQLVTVRNIFKQRKYNEETDVFEEEIFSMRNNFPLEVLSVGAVCPHGTITSGEVASLFVAQENTLNDPVAEMFTVSIPFGTSEMAFGEKVRRESIFSTYPLYFYFSCEVSKLNLPAELLGVEIPLTVTMKINIDERAVV